MKQIFHMVVLLSVLFLQLEATEVTNTLTNKSENSLTNSAKVEVEILKHKQNIKPKKKAGPKKCARRLVSTVSNIWSASEKNDLPNSRYKEYFLASKKLDKDLNIQDLSAHILAFKKLSTPSDAFIKENRNDLTKKEIKSIKITHTPKGQKVLVLHIAGKVQEFLVRTKTIPHSLAQRIMESDRLLENKQTGLNQIPVLKNLLKEFIKALTTDNKIKKMTPTTTLNERKKEIKKQFKCHNLKSLAKKIVETYGTHHQIMNLKKHFHYPKMNTYNNKFNVNNKYNSAANKKFSFSKKESEKLFQKHNRHN
jgi:hypothetical protein